MKTVIKYLLCALLLLCGSSLHAQVDFNPTNPSEPNLYLYRNVSVVSYPSAAGYVSSGGRWLEGSSHTLSTSARSTLYTFSHWTLNGEYYSSSSSFTFTLGSEDMVFVAHYDYTPPSPSEPSLIIKNELFLVPYPEGACTFNRASGTSVLYDDWVTLTATPSTGFQFLGWYDATGTKVSSSLSFNYQMPDEDATLTARFEYNPANPSEPSGDGSQTNVQTTPRGDVNKDLAVDLQDIVIVLNTFLGKNGNDESSALCDLNGDGTVDIEDVVKVLNVFLKK